MKKQITFRTFKQYCFARSTYQIGTDYEELCKRFPNHSLETGPGKCTEKKCPIWPKLRNA